MRQDSRVNSIKEKRVGNRRYSENQFEKWIQWRWKQFGKIRYKDLMLKIKEYNL